MSFNLTAGNPRAHRIRVYFENSGSATIYEGMPLCYNYDTTDNWFGGIITNGAVSATGTTAESSQNEGKYIRVELPANNNLMSFAGVVASGGWVGKADARALDIYVPNGAIVPVRCDVDTTVGVTILAITVASQELGQPVEGTSRPVAIAAETETGLDSTAGLTLATLDPNRFVYQNLDGTALGISTGTANIRVNEIKVTSAQTAGRLCALWVQAEITSTGGSYNGYALSIYSEADISGAVNGATAGTAAWVNVTGGTQTEPICALQAGFYEDGATLTSSNIMSVLQLTSQFTEDPQAGNHAWIYLEENGTYSPDAIFRCATAADISATASTSEPTWSTSHLKVPIIRTASTTYYLHATAD